jgi:exonuclease SbcC
VEAHRGLKRTSKTVLQDGCFIIEDGVRTELSPGDLKERVIRLLGFNEPPHPHAESLVFRYAVFTPQEQMKAIIQRNAEERLQVIRRVLGIQSYQVAAENAEVLQRMLRDDIRAIDVATEDLDEDEAEGTRSRSKVAQLDALIPRLEAMASAAGAEAELLEGRLEQARAERNKVSAAAAALPELRRSAARLRAAISEADRRGASLKARLEKEVKPAIEAFEGTGGPPARSAEELEADLESRRMLLGERRGTALLLTGRLDEKRELVAAGKCPRCGQPILGGFKDESAHLEAELKAVAAEVAALEAEVRSLSELAAGARRYAEEEKAHRRDVGLKAEIEAEVAESEGRRTESSAELARVDGELARLQSEQARLQDLTSAVESATDALKKSRSRREGLSRDLTESLTQRKDAAEALQRLEPRIEEKRRKRVEGRRLRSYASWLGEFFRPSVELIERQTLVQTNSRFGQHFQKFFASLVDDPDLAVRVAEDFTPLFERQGYLQEFDALSGGERTSVALAYRFALNAIVQEDLGSGAGDLVILDEPTDGFSKEQIHRMRDLLEALRAKQVILVSHEKELESMADHMMLVEKTNGTSHISRV